MKGAGSPKLFFENLDLTPIHPVLWTGLQGRLGLPVVDRRVFIMGVGVSLLIYYLSGRTMLKWSLHDG